MRQVLVILTLAAIAGCAANPQPMEVATADDTPQVCTREKQTGSDIPQTRCFPAQSAADRSAAYHELDNQLRVQSHIRPAGEFGPAFTAVNK